MLDKIPLVEEQATSGCREHDPDRCVDLSMDSYNFAVVFDPPWHISITDGDRVRERARDCWTHVLLGLPNGILVIARA